jgi:hypothetical protein
MDLTEIHKKYGTLGVVAYSCKLSDGVPEGGLVIAVQEGVDSGGIKEYLRQFKKKFPNKGPVCYIRVPIANQGKPLALVYDNGTGEKKALPKLEERKKSEPERLMSLVPDEALALIIASAFKKDDT